MSHNDQERFEDYLEVEQYIEDLRAGRKGVLPEDLSHEQAGVYHMAAQLRSAIPENAAPRPAFVEALQAKLQAELQAQMQEPQQEVSPSLPLQPEGVYKQEASLHVPPVEPISSARRKNTRSVSRRHLLTGGAVAAASLALGTTAGAAFEQQIHAPEKPLVSSVPSVTPVPTPTDWKIPLVGSNIPTQWQRVVALAQLGNDAHPFQTDAIVGYVMRSDESSSGTDTDNDKDSIIALSAACTHMGCLVHWQAQGRSFLCPCHNGQFNEYGEPSNSSPIRYLRALPRLNTRVGEDGYVYVEVPVKM